MYLQFLHMPKLKFSVLLLFIFLYTGGYAQEYTVLGKITDEESGEPLAFVNLVVNKGKYGTYTDIDGKYRLLSEQKIESIRASYVGYIDKEIKIDGRTGNVNFSMKRTSVELSEVVIFPKENPAHRIILNAIENRNNNNPSKLQSFSYTAYEKLIFTSDLDSLAHVDTLNQDSSLIRARKFFDNQYIGLIENVIHRSFKHPDKNLQKVVATKISGLKDPIFVFLLSQLQPVSFYDEIISIGSQQLVNPISKGSTAKYFFLIKDTVFSTESRDTTYVIFFRPFINTTFEGLTGLLYINTDKWAVQNVIARPYREEGPIGIKIQQMYAKVDNVHWFPVQLNTDLTLKGIKLEAGTDSTKRYHVVGKGKTYLLDIEINGKISKKNFSQVEIHVDPEAARRKEDYWERFRIDSLSARERRTYEFMDSLGKAENFDKKARNIETMITGRIPFGFLDIELNKIFRYNGFEGAYAGLGLITNRRLSQWFKVGGYWGYGFLDKKEKFGTSLSLFPLPDHEVEIRALYRRDVRESAGVSLFDDNSMIQYERFRNFLILNMDYDQTKQIAASFRTLKYWKIFAALSQTSRKTGYQYFYLDDSESGRDRKSTFNLAEVTTGFRFAYKEKFLKNARTQISLGTNYPIIYFQYGRGLNKMLNGNFAYDRLDVKITKSFYFKYLGRTSLCLNLGMVRGDVPYTELYNGNGSFRQFTIYTPNSFATMRMNEFLSDRYVAFYFTHNFGQLLLRQKWFHPEISIASNMAFGSLEKPGVHHLIAFDIMDKGYFESGLLLNNLINLGLVNLGIGAYYRYGAYSLYNWQDNATVKFSLMFPL